MFDQLHMMQKLMKNKSFMKLIMHPKMQKLLQDPEFLEAAKKKDMDGLNNHPKFQELLNDPELKDLVKDFKPEDLV